MSNAGSLYSESYKGRRVLKDLWGVQRSQALAAACGQSTAGPPLSHCSSSSLRPCSDRHDCPTQTRLQSLQGLVVTNDSVLQLGAFAGHS